MAPPDDDRSDGNTYARVVASAAFARAPPAERIKALLAVRAPPGDARFYTPFLEHDCRLEAVAAQSQSASSAVFRFRVARAYCNTMNNLHGGAQATIYDILTSIALQSFSGGGSSSGKRDVWAAGGVSRTLNVTYLRPAREGADVRCEVEVLHAGRSLSFLRASMRRADDGALISVCEHNKVAIPLPPGAGGAAKL